MNRTGRFTVTRFRAAVTALAVATVTVLVLSACQAAIPREGSVTVGLSDLSALDGSVIFTPSGPHQGASPEEIVRGFTNAASSAVDDYAIARSFLAPEFRKTWSPDAGVLIDEKARSSSLTVENTVELTIAPTATVDSKGVLTTTPPASYEELRYELEQVDGEWRIRSAPQGIVLDRATFLLVFNQHTLYFLEPHAETLVPDPRWFAVGTTTTTQIVTELLNGPSDQLADGVVTSAFPEGTTLAADSVPVVDGVAAIDFTPEAASADSHTLDLMLSQLGASLQSVTGVTYAALTVEQSEFANTDVTRGASINYPQVASKPVIQLGTEIGELTDQTLIGLGVWTKAIVAARPIDLIIRNGADAAVMRTENGVSWVNDQGQVTRLDSRPDLASPTLDRFNYVWSTQRTDPSQVMISSASGNPSMLNTPWAASANLIALRLSIDGTRLAALIDEGTGVTVQVVGVVRNEQGVPTALTQAKTVTWLPGQGIDLDWMNAAQLAVATQPETGNVRITAVGLGIFEFEIGTSPGITALAGANTRSELRALAANGVLRAPQGVTWRQVVKNITLLAKRG